MSRIIDVHSHVLPGIDDGSGSVRESIAMLRMAAEQGITHVVATPHFYPDRDDPRRFLERRDAAEEALRREMALHEGLPRLSVGAEVYFFYGISDSEILQELTIDKKSSILLEMPQSVWTDGMYREMENITTKQGITPIIAHVDRYIRPFRTYGIPDALAQLPVWVQANASFFLRPATRAMALRLLRQGKIHLLGSDCHNVAHRPPNLGSAVERIQSRLGDQALEWILDNQSAAFPEELL